MVLVLALAACSDKKAHELAFQVSFACDSDRDLADQLTLRVLRGGCDGDEALYEESISKGEQARAASEIAPGDYGLEASAFSGETLIATGCVETTLPLPSGADAPVVVLRSEDCDAPVDMDSGSPDLDAASDAGAANDLDAREASRDAGREAAAPAPDSGPRTCSSDCADSFPCTDDRCVNGECVHEPFTGTRECDDVACTQNDHCEMGTCQPGTPNDMACPDDGNPCTAETCEPGTGCNRDNAEGASCNDQIGCTNQDACKGGMCRGTDNCGSSGVCSAATGMCTACSNQADCDDRDPCTTDSCSAGSCKHVNNTGSCNDGKSCTNNDVCNNRVCAGTSTCPSDATCGGSTCRCNDSSKALCNNTCVTLSNSNTNCGQCNRTCNNGTCENSACKPNAASSCTAYRYSGHDYLVCSDNLNWASARDRCRGYGFGLAIIDNSAENDFLKARTNGIDRWMGANDRGSNGKNCVRDDDEGAWYWASPSDNSTDHFKLFCAFADRDATTCTLMNSGYQNWRSGEPNNDNCSSCVIGDCTDGEDCGMFNADGSWNDAECSNGRGFICESP